jgi:hypothetical protein
VVASPLLANVRASFCLLAASGIAGLRTINLVGSKATNFYKRWQRALFHPRFLLSPFSDLHACAEAAHVAIAGQEVIGARDWLCGLLQCIEPACMFNAPLEPVTTQQENKRLTAGDVLSVERVIESIEASAG